MKDLSLKIYAVPSVANRARFRRWLASQFNMTVHANATAGQSSAHHSVVWYLGTTS